MNQLIRLKISLASKGKHYSPQTEFKKGNIPWTKGVPHELQPLLGSHHSKMHNKNISLTRRRLFREGKLKVWSEGLSKETNEILRLHSIRMSGKGNPSYGKTPDKKMCIFLSEINKGAKNFNWNGGSSLQKYPTEFNRQLKRVIKRQNNSKCMICSARRYKHKFHTHHIDLNKNNCNPNNLVPLCSKCHNFTHKIIRLLENIGATTEIPVIQ